MNKENCNVVRDLMPLVIDEVASAESQELVNEHLKECEDCQGVMRIMRMAVNSKKMNEKDDKFVQLCLRVRAKLSWKRVVAGAALLTLMVGLLAGMVSFVNYKTSVDMRPFTPEKCDVAVDANGYLLVNYSMVSRYKCRGITFDWNDQTGIYFITPHKAAWPSTIRETRNEVRYSTDDVRLVDGSLKMLYGYYSEIMNDYFGNPYSYEEVEPVMYDIAEIRVGTPENYLTIYCAGDEIKQLNTSIVQARRLNPKLNVGEED